MVIIRKMKESDIELLSDQFIAQGWGSRINTFKTYNSEQNTGKRDVLIAEYEGKLAAYITIQWQSKYKPFQENNIPEIKDLNTFIKYRNKGLATILMDQAENLVLEKGYETVGLGVGLYTDYGIAQRMYVKRGYNFDGMGVNYSSEIIEPGNDVHLDDNLSLCMTKKLKDNE